jgi:hypothetical protein
MRKIGAALLFMMAGAFLLLAWFALENLWAEYQDSPDALYLSVAAIEIVGALGFAGLGGWMLRGR